MRTAGILLLSGLLMMSTHPALAGGFGQLTPEQWREDLQVLDRAVREHHGNPFHTVSVADYTAMVQRLEAEIPDLTDHQILVRMSSIVAAVNDGHTRLGGWLFDPAWNMGWYPVGLYWFSDGLYVRQAHPEHADLVGARVVKVGSVTAEEAQERMAAVVAADNRYGKRFAAPFGLVSPEVLVATGLLEDLDSPPYVLERNGRTWTAHVPRYDAPHPGWVRGFVADETWVDANHEATAPVPLWLRHVGRTFWMEYLEDEKLLYVQQNQVRNGPTETLAMFAERVFDFVETNDVQTLVLDVRLNGGGNNYLNRPTIVGMIRTPPIARRGHSFTIIGRQTFSACQNLVNELSRYSETIFVGEPTGERVNFYGDTRATELPHSGLTVRVSYLWWQNHDPRDTRDALEPDLAAELSFADYAANRDPAMEAILAFEGIIRTDDVLATLDTDGVDAAVALLEEALADPLYRFRDLEREINGLGYALMGQGRVPEAITIFQVNVDHFPDSWNVYDSLGEAYVAAGDPAKALELYRKSLSLNPTSPTGLEAVERLAEVAESESSLDGR